MDSFRVLGPNRVAYLDWGGSGNETNAHLLADGRITVMFCAFDRAALIVRLYGRGVAVLPQDAGWNALAAHFTIETGVRQIFDIAVETVQTSCGYAVPSHDLRPRAADAAQALCARRRPETNLAKWETRVRSIDGLPTRPPSAVASRLMPLVVVETLFDRIAGEIARGRLRVGRHRRGAVRRRHRLGHRRRPVGSPADGRRRRRGRGAGAARRSATMPPR